MKHRLKQWIVTFTILFACGTAVYAATTAQWLKDGIFASAGTLTPTSGNIAIADGTSFKSVTMSGGATISSTGVLTSTIINTTQSGAGYTLVLADQGTLIHLNNVGAQTINIPTDASVAFPTGTQIFLDNYGAGLWTIAATTPGTTTVRSTGAVTASPVLRAQYSGAALTKIAVNDWLVQGDIQ